LFPTEIFQKFPTKNVCMKDSVLLDYPRKKKKTATLFSFYLEWRRYIPKESTLDEQYRVQHDNK